MEILNNGIGGVVAAVVLALLVSLYNRGRVYQAHRKLRQAIGRPDGVSTGIDGVGVPLKNNTGIAVIVRSVTLLVEGQAKEPGFGRANITLSYDGPTGGQIRRHPHESMGLATDLMTRAHVERGFVVLPPKCEGVWRLPPEFIGLAGDNPHVTRCRITFEYRTLLGETVVEEIDAPAKDVQWLDAGLQDLVTNRDKINAARAKLGLLPFRFDYSPAA